VPRIALAGVAAAVFAGGCATADGDAAAREPDAARVSRAVTPGLLRNADFEADAIPGRACPASWWCTMHNDTTSFAFSLVTGSGSHGRYLKVARLKMEPWALVTQVIPAAGLAGRRMRVSVAVNAENLDGGAGLLVILQGNGGRVLGDRKVLQARGPGWHRVGAEIDVVAGTEMVEVGLILEGGGEAGFDDVEVTVLPPARP
jgi:hypothetical protein